MKAGRTALWLAACVSLAFDLAAQPTPPANDADERARSLHEQGVAAFEAGDYDRAIAAFSEAYELSPAPGILFNLGQAHVAKGPSNCAEARRAYSMYLQAAPNARNRQAVQTWIDELAACADAEEARRAQASTPPAAAGPADEASAPPAPVTVFAEPAAPVSESRDVPWLAIGAGSLGVVAAAIGGVMYASAGSDYSELKDSCGNQCAPSSWEDAADRERTGLVLIGVGSALAIGSLVIWLATGSAGEPPQRARAAHPGGFVTTW